MRFLSAFSSLPKGPARSLGQRLFAGMMVLLIVAMVFVIIGVSAYLIEVGGMDAKRQWWLMLPAIALALLVVWRGIAGLQRPRPVYASREDMERQADLARERRVRELERHPDRRFRRYAKLVAEGYWVSDQEIRRRETRLAAIANDPVKSKYADRIFRGDPADDDTIAYWENPSAHRSCRHLKALEDDLRRADPTMRPWYGGLITEFDADWPALRRRYDLDDPVRFEPGGQDERGEPSGARVLCGEHRASILFGTGSRRFPH